MSAISLQLFEDASSLSVRNVILSASDSLQTYREKLARVILDEMYQFVGLLDAGGMTLEINRAALEGAGIKLRDIQDKPFWEARWWQVSRETREKQRELCGRAAAGEFIRCDMEIYGRSGGEETIIIDFSLLPVRDHQGKILFLLAEGRNITEKKAAEAEIARKNEELQNLLEQIRHLDQLKSDLFANISHELRTPLALILGPAESILASANNLTDLQRRDLSVIRHNAATLLKHVNDLLDLAKLDAGKMTMDYVDLDLARLVRTIAAHFDALAPQKSISYAVLTPDVLRAEVDPEKLERVLLNLLSNAFKFTPNGGRIQCALSVSGNRFVLTVQDSGPGIPPALRSSIFERFRQGQGGTTREFGGTGLGLSIAKDFVELHAGLITLSDAATGGTLAQLEIPLRAPQGSIVRKLVEAGPPTTRAMAASTTVEELRSGDTQEVQTWGEVGKPKVLVVEDHPEMRRFIAEVLSNEFRVIIAADGLEGLSMAAAETPDLVVTDLMMPKLGGDQFVQQMRVLEALKQLPVLVLSAKADETLRLQMLAELAQDYLVKPFSSAELLARVRNLVAMKRSRDMMQRELASQSQDLAFLTQELIASLTERKCAEEAAHTAKARLEGLVRIAQDAIISVDSYQHIMLFNQGAEKIFGYEQAEVIGRSLDVLLPSRFTDVHRRHIEGFAASPETARTMGQRREVSARRKDGSEFPAEASISKLNLGSELVYTIILRDISERKQAEQELRRSEACLAEAQVELAHVTRLTALSELTASIAHELNQPLAGAVANGDACLAWLSSEPPNLDEARAAGERMIESATQATDIVHRIRSLFKKTAPERTRVNINDVIEETLSLIRSDTLKSGVSLQTELASELPLVLADRVQLQQVVLNLVKNGMEAMSGVDDRTLELRIRSAIHDPNQVLVAVADSGAGIDPQVMGRIFEPFYTTKPQGIGMGLAISRSIIEAHGGRLWAEPNTAHGATVQCTLPAHVESAQ